MTLLKKMTRKFGRMVHSNPSHSDKLEVDIPPGVRSREYRKAIAKSFRVLANNPVTDLALRATERQQEWFFVGGMLWMRDLTKC